MDTIDVAGGGDDQRHGAPSAGLFFRSRRRVRGFLRGNPLAYLSCMLWKHARGNRGQVVLYVLLFTVAYAINALEPLIVGMFLNAIQTEGINRENFLRLVSLLLLLPLKEIVSWAFHGPARIIENRNAFLVRANYKEYLLHGTLSMPLPWHAGHRSGDTVDRVEKGTQALFSFSAKTFEILQACISLATALGVLLFFNFAAGAAVIFTIFVTFAILIRFDRSLVPLYREVHHAENEVSAKVFDALGNVTTVVVLRIARQILSSLRAAIHAPFLRYESVSRLNEWKWFSASLLGRIAVVLAVGISIATQALTGTVLVGTVYVLYGYASQIRETFFRFAGMYNEIVRSRVSVANAEEIAADFRPRREPGNKRLPSGWKLLEIRNLNFAYPGQEGGRSLYDMALTATRGERIALIGESGSGKSTFLQVFRNLYVPETLEIAIDGRSVGGFRAISDSIALIPQDPEIFTATIRENITLGVEVPDEVIRVFTNMACFTEVAKRLPHGLESSIAEKGVNLSGGQRQRLALARGLLASSDKDIVLLDEPTSSVDFHNELQVYRNVFAAFAGKLVISTIHHLHLLSLFDRIHVFAHGRIVDSGSFAQLMAGSQAFRHLWEKYKHTRDGSARSLP